MANIKKFMPSEITYAVLGIFSSNKRDLSTHMSTSYRSQRDNSVDMEAF